MELEFNTRGNEKQKLCVKHWVDNDIIDIVYGGSKGSAKSYTGCSLIFGDALMYPETHYFIARKRLNDLRKFTIPSIYEVFQHWGLDTSLYLNWNGQDSVFTLPNKSKVFLLDAKYLPSDPTYARFGSMQNTRGWIEEAGEFEEAAKNNLHASVGRWKNDVYGINGKILQTCNPQKNYLYRSYYKPNKAGTLSKDVKFIQALPQDNKMLPKGYIENLHKILSEPEKRRLLYGEWEYDSDGYKLMKYDAIVDLFTNDHIEKDNYTTDGRYKGIKYITCDVARFGDDKTVIMLWHGWKVSKIITIDKSGLDEVVRSIQELKKIEGVMNSNIIVDEDGVGGGVKDFLKCKGFQNGSKALIVNGKRENFNNLKSQAYFKIATKVNKGEIYLCVEDVGIKNAIIEELEVVRVKDWDKDSKQAIESKDKVKDLIGRSPDYSDAISMRWFFDNTQKSSYKIS